MMLAKLGYKNILGITLCLFFIVPLVTILYNTVVILNNGVETTATVIYLSSGSRARPERAFVHYVAGDAEYSNYVPVKKNRFRPDESVSILYYPGDPNKITLKNREDAAHKVKYLVLNLAMYSVLLLFLAYSSYSNVKQTDRELLPPDKTNILK